MRLFKLVLVAALTAAPAMTFAQTTAQEQPKNHEREQARVQPAATHWQRNQERPLTPRQDARLERQQRRFIARCAPCVHVTTAV